MVFDENGKFWINPHIQPLIDRENQHAVIGRIIRTAGTSAVKQVFNSGREFSIYQVMVQLCPNHLVFPNSGLQSFMQYERMKELVDQDDFGYYLRASVDILLVSSTTFLPMLAIEVDSPWHDTEHQQVRDDRKDRLFAVAGVPFLRLRPVGSPSENVIRGQVAEHLQELVRVMRPDLPGYEQTKELLTDLSRVTAAAAGRVRGLLGRDGDVHFCCTLERGQSPHQLGHLAKERVRRDGHSPCRPWRGGAGEALR